MKKLILSIFAVVLFAVTLSAQERGTSRDFWFRPVQVQTNNILPRPVYADALMGYVGGKWGPVRNQVQFGTVADTCDADGLVVVDVTVESASYQLFVTPVSALGIHPAVSAQTDSSFTVKFWLNDTAANANPIQFHWHLHE